MSAEILLLDVLATVVYPGMTSLCVFWTSVAIARWVTARRTSDLLLAATMLMAAASFAVLSLSTGLFSVFQFVEMRLSIRLGFLATLVAGLAGSIGYIRRQHAIYRQRPKPETE